MGNLTSAQIGGIVLFFLVIIAVVVLILTKKKDKSTPTMGPYPSIIPSQTPGASQTPGVSQTPGASQTPGVSQTPGGGLINNSVFYDSSTGQILPNSSPCYTCYQQDNVCGCLMNNNCNPIPQVCQTSPCFQYETEYGGGNNVCNSEGIAAYTKVLGGGDLCDKDTCKSYCGQGQNITGLPSCTSCCDAVCSTCTRNRINKNVTRTTPPAPPPGNQISCSECDDIYNIVKGDDSKMMQIIGMNYNQCKSICYR